MKKIFSLVLLTGMLTLMSFSVKEKTEHYEEQLNPCFWIASDSAAYIMQNYGLSFDEVGPIWADLYDECMDQ